MPRYYDAPDNIFGALLDSGAIGRFGQVIDTIIAQKRQDEEDQGKNLDTLITKLTDPKLSEAEQANEIQRQVQLIPDKVFKRRYGITKDEMLAGMEPASGTDEAAARDAGLPPQSPQDGPMGARVARRGVLPEQRMREAVAAQAEGTVAEQQVEIDTKKMRLKLVEEGRNYNLNQAIATLRSEPGAWKRKGKLLTVNEAKQILTGDPTTDESVAALMGEVAIPSALDAIVTEATRIYESNGYPPEVALAKAKKHALMMQVEHPESAARLNNLYKEKLIEALGHQIRASELEEAMSASGRISLKPSEIESMHKGIEDALMPAWAFMKGDVLGVKGKAIAPGAESYQVDPTTGRGYNIGPNGEVLLKGKWGTGKDASTSPESKESAFSRKPGSSSTTPLATNVNMGHWLMLFDPTSPEAMQEFINNNEVPPDANQALQRADVERVLGIIAKKLGHTIDSITVPTPNGQPREMSREAIVALALQTRKSVIPRRATLQSGATFEAQQAQDFFNALQVIGRELGTTPPAPAGGAPPATAPDAIDDPLGAYVFNYMQQQRDIMDAHQNRLQQLQEALGGGAGSTGAVEPEPPPSALVSQPAEDFGSGDDYNEAE